MVHLLMGERRGLNPRVVDSQSTALIHLATSAPTPAQVEVSIYDQILSEPPYDRYQREAFSYTRVASLLLCFGIRGSKASTSRPLPGKASKKEVRLFTLGQRRLTLEAEHEPISAIPGSY